MGDDDNRDLSNWEKQAYDEWDSDSSEERIQGEKDRCKERLWSSFQSSASAVAYMYKGIGAVKQGYNIWVNELNWSRITFLVSIHEIVIKWNVSLHTVSSALFSAIKFWKFQSTRLVSSLITRLWVVTFAMKRNGVLTVYIYVSDGSSEGRVATLWVPFKSAASAVTILYKGTRGRMSETIDPFLNVLQTK